VFQVIGVVYSKHSICEAKMIPIAPEKPNKRYFFKICFPSGFKKNNSYACINVKKEGN